MRSYEWEELLSEPARTPAGYRLCDEVTVERRRFVQRLGLPLADIRDLLAVRDTGVCPAPASSTRQEGGAR